jgi:hypothetical protein
MPLASNPFSFGMSNMTLQMSSYILTSNVNTSFRSRGMSPSYNPFMFGGGHIPHSFHMIRGWNPSSSRPNPSYNFQGCNGQMSGVSTSYILSVYLSSIIPFPVNASFMENPPATSDITSGWAQFSNMSSRGNGYPHMDNLYPIAFSSQVSPSGMIPS